MNTYWYKLKKKHLNFSTPRFGTHTLQNALFLKYELHRNKFWSATKWQLFSRKGKIAFINISVGFKSRLTKDGTIGLKYSPLMMELITILTCITSFWEEEKKVKQGYYVNPEILFVLENLQLGLLNPSRTIYFLQKYPRSCLI